MDNHDLLEFDKLKDEQIGRLAYRDNLFYLTMGIIGGIVATYFAYAKAEIVILWLPFATFIIGIAHLTCERRIQDIGLYIHKHLTPLIATQSGRKTADVFAWEIFVRKSRWHPWRKMLHQISSVMLYVLSGVVAIATYLFPHGALRSLNWPEFLMVGTDIGLIFTMFSLIMIFEHFSPDATLPDATKRRSVLSQLIISAAAAVAAGGAAYCAFQIIAVPPDWQAIYANAHAPFALPVAASIAASFVVWSLVLLSGRR